MHRIFICFGLLIASASPACSTAPPIPPRPLPKADWIRGAMVYVDMAGSNGQPRRDDDTVRAAEADFRSAGARVLTQRMNKGELHVTLEYMAASETRSRKLEVKVLVEQAGEILDQFQFSREAGDLPCTSIWTLGEQCNAREAVARILESKAIAAAMSRSASTPTAVPGAQARGGKLAVLELRNYAKELTKENVQYLTDVVRQAALKSSGADVMTRENLLVLLTASGKDLANCEGECEVDTGRRIGADEIVSGDVQKFGSKFKVSLRLHDTREGKLLSSATGTGGSVDDLEDSVSKAAQQLFTAGSR